MDLAKSNFPKALTGTTPTSNLSSLISRFLHQLHGTHFVIIYFFLLCKSLPFSCVLYVDVCRFAEKLPAWIFKLMLVFMFFVEIPAPFLIFGSPILRLISAVSILSLMFGIQLAGTFGYFSLITAVSCIHLLDLNSSLFDYSPSLSLWSLLEQGLIVIVLLNGCIHLVFNSWVAFGFHYWPAVIVPFPSL